MRRKKWVVSKGDKELASIACEELNIHPLAALIVTSRGLDSIEKIEDFFAGDSFLTVDPLSIRDMDKAAARITKKSPRVIGVPQSARSAGRMPFSSA